jgi:DNA repair protein RadC
LPSGVFVLENASVCELQDFVRWNSQASRRGHSCKCSEARRQLAFHGNIFGQKQEACSPQKINLNQLKKENMNVNYGDSSNVSNGSGRLKDQPAGERPRERLVQHGAAALSAAELIAILVRTGLRGVNALDIGKQLIQRFGSLGAMARASVDEMQCIRGIGRDKAVTLVAAFALASKIAEELQRESPVLDNPQAITDLLREQNRTKNVETFQILMLNTRRRLIRVEQVSQGLLDTILVHPREVFNSAIAARASAIVLVHNHPSGDPTPSDADIKVTRDLIRAGQLLKIEILDHVILGRATADRAKDYSSLRELGYFHS